MKRLIKKSVILNEEIIKKYLNDNKDYNFDKFLNWKDDGDQLNDPSINDYLKGYQINPYEFKQWANSKSDFIKESAKETDNMQMLPWYLADKILRLWNGADGPLQSFFEGFTLRYPNSLKKELAMFLEMVGYKVYPVLTMDKPIYANKINTTEEEHCLECNECPQCGITLDNSECKNCDNRYEKFQGEWHKIELVSNFRPFQDYQLSDESLKQTEEFLSGNRDPLGYGVTNTVDNLRNEPGVMPSDYEVRIDGHGLYAKRLKKK